MTFITIPNRPTGGTVRSIEQLLANFDAVTAGVNAYIAKRRLLLHAQGNVISGTNDSVVETILPFRGPSIPVGTDEATPGTFAFPPPVWLGDFNGIWAMPPTATKFRIRATVATNSVAPTKSFTVVLSKLTSSGGASGNINWATSQQALAFVTPQVVTPAANSVTNVESAEFGPLPTDSGVYLFTCLLNTATLAAGAIVSVSAQLYTYNA